MIVEVFNDKTTISSFKEKTKIMFHELDGMGADEIVVYVKNYIQEIISEYNLDVIIKDVILAGSRCRGIETENSDLDMILYFTGSEREDTLFNLLHEDEIVICGVPLDVNPISEEQTGSLSEYLKSVEKYLTEKKARLERKIDQYNTEEKKMVEHRIKLSYVGNNGFNDAYEDEKGKIWFGDQKYGFYSSSDGTLDGEPAYPIKNEEYEIIKEKPQEHPRKKDYMLLSRLKSDCEYFIASGNKAINTLWADSPKEQIQKMKELWNSFSPEDKPEWITLEDILAFENRMCPMPLLRITVKDYVENESLDEEIRLDVIEFSEYGKRNDHSFWQGKLKDVPEKYFDLNVLSGVIDEKEDFKSLKISIPMLEKTKKYISNYCNESYGYDADFSDLENVFVGTTNITDEDIPITFAVDLLRSNLKVWIGNDIIQEDTIPDKVVAISHDYFKDLTYPEILNGWEEEAYRVMNDCYEPVEVSRLS